MIIYLTREAWLSAATDAMRPMFTAAGNSIPAGRAAIGFTSQGRKGRAIGECWNPIASADSNYEIFIRVDISDPAMVLGILAHELTHAALPLGSGHGPVFRKLALAIGLEGKMTQALPGAELAAELALIAAELGELPHGALAIGQVEGGRKKQKTNMLKATCPITDCGYTVRLTAKHADKGAPYCGQHCARMEMEGAEQDGDELQQAA